MELGTSCGGSITAVAKKIRQFADALDAAGAKLPKDSGVVILAEVSATLYKPLQKRKKTATEKAIEETANGPK